MMSTETHFNKRPKWNIAAELLHHCLSRRLMIHSLFGGHVLEHTWSFPIVSVCVGPKLFMCCKCQSDFSHLLTQMPHAACLAMEETYFFFRVIICMCCYAVIINQSECSLSTSSQYLTEKSVHYSLHNIIQSLIMDTCQTEWYVTVSSPQFIEYV